MRIATADDAVAVADTCLAARKQFLPYAPPAYSDEEIRRWHRTN